MKIKKMAPNPLALMESTRAMGYSTETAIADIIDNSLAAKADKIDILYTPDTDEPYIAILDNGTGMDSNEIDLAMQYGGKSPLDKRKKNDLGRFGLGLKTASLSQCDRLIVLSKQKNAIVGRAWDIEYVKQAGEWNLQVLESEEIGQVPEYSELESYKHGTLVVWQRLERMQQGAHIKNVLSGIMNKVRGHLALVFHRYMDKSYTNKPIKIYMNYNEIQPSDPFLRKKSHTTMAPYTIAKTKIKVTPYQLPHVSKLTKKSYETLGITDDLQKNQGFYIYRNQRLIIWGTWFKRGRKSALSQLARVQIDIPAEYDKEWVLDVKKSSTVPPPAVMKALDNLIDTLAEQSKKTWTYRGRKETSDKIEHIWNRKKTREDGYLYEINENHPLVKDIFMVAPEAGRKLKVLLRLIGDLLPLNQLMVDLNSDDINITNDVAIDEDTVRAALESMLQGTTEGTRSGFIDSLKDIEPFCSYKKLLKEYING